jgi:hypothetical protein
MLVNILSQTLHETGHHVVYQVMGRDPVWGFTKLVQLWESPPTDPDDWVEVNGEGRRARSCLSPTAAVSATNCLTGIRPTT